MLSDDKTPDGKNPKGTVSIENFRGRLRFRFNGQRYSMSLGIPDTQINRRVAEARARQIEDDMRLQLAHGGDYFDATLEKYKPESVLSVSDPDIRPKTSISLPEIWFRYTETKKSGKSPATIRMYGWVSNHLERCPYKLPTEAQAIFDWLNANVPVDSTKRVLMHLSACCKWAIKSELLDIANPFQGMAAEVKVKKAGTEEDEVGSIQWGEPDSKAARLMDQRKQERLKACLQEVAQILYEDSDPAAIQDLEGIEKTVRSHLLEQVGPKIGHFLSSTRPELGRDGRAS